MRLRRFFTSQAQRRFRRSTTPLEESSMVYTNLGRSGLKVSRFSYGNWVNCKDGEDSQALANELVQAAYENGINFFDTAEVYNSGEAERQLGTAFKQLGVPRSDVVISTKLFWGNFSDNTNKSNNIGTSRKHLIEGMDRSLGNLDMDYADVLFCHRYDEHTPTIEVVQTMKDLIDQGKIFYWGTSEWPAVRVMEAIHLADKIGCPRPIAEQCNYNMFERGSIEREYVALFDDYDYGSTIWSPLASGILTGKYNEGIPEGSRFDQNEGLMKIYENYFGEGKTEGTVQVLNGVKDIADQLGCTQGQLAIAWTVYSLDVSTCILGATSKNQLLQNLGALEVLDKITPEIEAQIEAVLGNAPKAWVDFRSWEPMPNRR